MEFNDIYKYCVKEMVEAKRQYDENSTMMFNAKQEGIDYHDWPQYTDQFALKARWNTLRELKEMLVLLGNPDIEKIRTEFTKEFGIT